MNRRNILRLSVITALGFALLPGSAVAQQKTLKEQLIGTWSFVSWERTYPDGQKNQAFGADPNGINSFDSNGRFSLIILRRDLPKLAADDFVKPTPEEALAIAKGVVAYFGTYTVDEADKSVSLNFEGTSITNQMERPQKRIVTAISADELKYRTATTQVEVALKRVK
jgi:hypothetical protein